MQITWLFTVSCKQCGETINMGPAPPPAEVHAPVSEAAEVYCPHCATVNSYSADECIALLLICPALNKNAHFKREARPTIPPRAGLSPHLDWLSEGSVA